MVDLQTKLLCVYWLRRFDQAFADQTGFGLSTIKKWAKDLPHVDYDPLTKEYVKSHRVPEEGDTREIRLRLNKIMKEHL